MIDSITQAVNTVIGPAIRLLLNAVAASPEEEPRRPPLSAGDREVQRYIERKAQAVDRAYKIMSLADLGAGGLVHGYATGNKTEMATSAAGILLSVAPELKPVSGALSKLGIKVLTNNKGVLTAEGSASVGGKPFNLLRQGNKVEARGSGVFVAESAFGKGYVTFRIAAASKSGMVSVDFHGIEPGLRKMHFIIRKTKAGK